LRKPEGVEAFSRISIYLENQTVSLWDCHACYAGTSECFYQECTNREAMTIKRRLEGRLNVFLSEILLLKGFECDCSPALSGTCSQGKCGAGANVVALRAPRNDEKKVGFTQ
jgi:hypothetical protein